MNPHLKGESEVRNSDDGERPDLFGERRLAPPLIGIQQIGLEGATDEDEIQWRTAQMIARALNTRRVIGFLGAGISKAYNFPSWPAFAAKVVRIALDKLPADPSTRQVRNLLETYVNHGDASHTVELGEDPALSEPDRTLTVLGSCDDAILEKMGPLGHKRFREEVAEIISGIESSPSERADDPLRDIMERLEIRRFLTTNYDSSVERAFERVGHFPTKTLMERMEGETLSVPFAEGYTTRVRPVAQSFAFGVDGPDALLQFAVGAPGHEMGVFHLHGVASQPGSMIVTEGDYQRLYLQDNAWHRAYREALTLSFSANPVLFMGVGLTEADLLRPLRQFVSERHGTRPERPLFALYERPHSDTRAAEWRRYLYARFGLKVLYYESKGGADMERTQALCQAVKDLSQRWLGWWRNWQHKPAIRAASFRKPSWGNGRVMVRHETGTLGLLESKDDDELLKKMLQSNQPDSARVVLALGLPGSGKGSLGLRLVKEDWLVDATEKEDGRGFFATAHFTNEFLSMIQAAVDHLDSPARNGNVLERLVRTLIDRPHVFVLGGVERILIPVAATAKNDEMISDKPAVIVHPKYPVTRGRPASVEAEDFLDAMKEVASAKGRGRVILTSSVWPVSLDKCDVRPAFLQGVSVEALIASRGFKKVRRDLVERLSTAMGGHAYALAVVSRAIERMDDQKDEAIERLIARVTAMDLPRRPQKAVEFGLKGLIRAVKSEQKRESAEEAGRAELLEGVLERIALFSTPVPRAAVNFCYEQGPSQGAATDVESPARVSDAIKELDDANLLLTVKGDDEDRFTAHTVVRTYVLELLGCLPDSPGEAQHFRVGGFGTEETEAEPGSVPGYYLISSSVDKLLANIEQTVRSLELQKREHRQIIRGAFGLIRSRWTATGVARLGNLIDEGTIRGSVPPYYQYRQRLASLLNCVRRVQAGPEWETAPQQAPAPQGILYVDELLWLYNELALSAFCQGSMHDAYALFRMVQDVVACVESSERRERWCQSEINLGLVQLERGWLRRARYHLENALRIGRKLPQCDVRNQAIGFLGLVSHLCGDYAGARSQYDEAISGLNRDGNGRALSIFFRHRGDLLRRLGKFKEAGGDIEASIAAAESGRYPDLVYYARLAQANIRRRWKKDLGAVNMVSDAAAFARKVGLPKLEADAYVVHAQFALAQGDIDLAGRRSAEALAIASALGMGLRTTGALVLAARVADVRGYPRQARKILEAAVELAGRQGHQLRVEAAEQELMRLPRA